MKERNNEVIWREKNELTVKNQNKLMCDTLSKFIRPIADRHKVGILLTLRDEGIFFRLIVSFHSKKEVFNPSIEFDLGSINSFFGSEANLKKKIDRIDTLVRLSKIFAKKNEKLNGLKDQKSITFPMSGTVNINIETRTRYFQ